MPSLVYNRGMFDSGSGNVWGTMDSRILLVGTGYTVNRDHDFVADVVANEISTTNYSRITMTGEVLTLDDTNDRVLNDADDVVWTALGPATGGPVVAAGIVFRQTGSDATAPLWFFMDGADTQVNGGNLTYQWAATGLAVQTSP
jgi:hypothetical protein